MNPLAFSDYSAFVDRVGAHWRAAIVLAVLLLVTVLAGCAAPQAQSHQVPLIAAPAKAQPIVVGTLATNACELQTAPTYTAAIVAVRQAEARVRAGTLPLARAQLLADLGRFARADLDAACPGKQLDPDRLRAAQEAVAAMQSILKE